MDYARPSSRRRSKSKDYAPPMETASQLSTRSENWKMGMRKGDGEEREAADALMLQNPGQGVLQRRIIIMNTLLRTWMRWIGSDRC